MDHIQPYLIHLQNYWLNKNKKAAAFSFISACKKKKYSLRKTENVAHWKRRLVRSEWQVAPITRSPIKFQELGCCSLFFLLLVKRFKTLCVAGSRRVKKKLEETRPNPTHCNWKRSVVMERSEFGSFIDRLFDIQLLLITSTLDLTHSWLQQSLHGAF